MWEIDVNLLVSTVIKIDWDGLKSMMSVSQIEEWIVDCYLLRNETDFSVQRSKIWSQGVDVWRRNLIFDLGDEQFCWLNFVLSQTKADWWVWIDFEGSSLIRC